MAEGISPNPLNKISQVYLDRIAKINTDPEVAQKEREKWQTEAKVDTGSAEEKATARNKRNTPAGKDYDFDNKVFITRKPGESLESARTRKRRDAHAAKRGVKENFSDWRTDLREIVDEIESEAEKKVEEKKGIKNKVVINPKLTETVESMGGRLLEVKEIDDDEDADKNEKAEALKKKEAMLKKRIVRMKMQAVNQGAGENIIAGYEPEGEMVEGKIADKLKQVVADMKAADRKAGLLPGGKDVVDLDVERQRRRKKVEEGKLTSVKATTYGMPPEERKAHIDAERKRLGVKPKPEKKIEEEVGISSTEKMAAARKEAKIRAKEAAAVKKAKGDKQKAAARKKSVNANKQLSSSELKKYDTDGDGKIRVVNASFSNWKKELIEKDLNAKERRALPDKDFVFPGKGEGPEGKQRGAYPIPDKSHARNALAMAAAHASPEKEAKVKAAVKKKFPGIQQEDYETQKRKEVLSALKRDKRPLDKKTKEKIASDIVKKKGDTSKSDDRYAYEEVQQEGYKKLPVAKMASKISKKQFKAGQSGDVKTISKKSTETGKMIGVLDTHDPERSKSKSKMQEGLVGAKVDSQKEVNKATRKAAFRPFANTKPPKLKVAEDRAFDNVVGQLRKKYGKGAVLTKDSPPPKVNKNTQQKQQRRRAAADEKERRFKQRNPAVTSNRYPKIDQEAWDKAREREKREGIS